MDNEFQKALNKEIAEVNQEIAVLTIRRNALEALCQSYNSYNAIPTQGLVTPDTPKIVNAWQEQSGRDCSVFYNVTEYNDGTMHCTCPGFKYRGECKHVW